MQVRYFKEYSANLDRDMEFKMYGHAGVLCLVIPCQDGRFSNGKTERCLTSFPDWWTPDGSSL